MKDVKQKNVNVSASGHCLLNIICMLGVGAELPHRCMFSVTGLL